MITKGHWMLFFCLFSLTTNLSCYYNPAPLKLEYNSEQESIYDANGSIIRSLQIQKFDSLGNFKGEITYRKIIDSIGNDTIFISKINKDYEELTNCPIFMESGFLYKAEGKILGFDDTLNFGYR